MQKRELNPIAHHSSYSASRWGEGVYSCGYAQWSPFSGPQFSLCLYQQLQLLIWCDLQTDLVRLNVMQISFGTIIRRRGREKGIYLVFFGCASATGHSSIYTWANSTFGMLHCSSIRLLLALLQLFIQSRQRRKNVRVWWFRVYSLFCGTPLQQKSARVAYLFCEEKLSLISEGITRM